MTGTFSHLSPPLTDQVAVMLVVSLVIFLAPRLLNLIRIPGIIGFILAGVLLGPNGFNIIGKTAGLEIFATVGLLYLMFLVGLEIDMADFRKNREKTMVFGILTFIVPLSLGFLVCYYILRLDIAASLLLAAMFSTQTLVSYPIASRLGITRHRVISMVAGATIITDTAALLLLAVISSAHTEHLDLIYLLRILMPMSVLLLAMFWLVPRLARWFFSVFEDDGGSQFLFIFVIVFLSSFLARLSGIEPMVGAFLAGIALNRSIPKNSILMVRTVFIGNTIFIPFFLIGVGMVVDLKVLLNGWNALIIAAILVITAEITKYLAAFATQKLYKMSRTERHVLFGLSSSHAAATIALVMVGYEMGLLNIDILNGTVLVIFFSCLISSFVTENAGRALAIQESARVPAAEELPQRILVPVSNPDTVGRLLNFAFLIKKDQQKEPVMPLSIIIGNPDNEEVNSKILEQKTAIEKHLPQGMLPGQIRMVNRLDTSVANGINRALKELVANQLVIGWNGNPASVRNIFGGILGNLLPRNNVMIFVVKVLKSFSHFRRIHIMVPPNAEFEPGFEQWLDNIATLSNNIQARIIMHAPSQTLSRAKAALEWLKVSVDIRYTETDQYGQLEAFRRQIHPDDLIILITARERSVSYDTSVAQFPRYLSKFYEECSFILLYPRQYLHDNSNATGSLDGLKQSPIAENIERISRFGQNVKKAMKGKN